MDLDENLAEYLEIEKMGKETVNRIVLRMKQEITKLENTYKRADKMNQQMKKILSIFQEGLKYPEYHNYNTFKSIINNCKFNLDSSILDGETISEQLDYLTNYFEKNKMFYFQNEKPKFKIPEEKLLSKHLSKTIKQFHQEIECVLVLSDKKTFGFTRKYGNELQFFDMDTFQPVGKIVQKENMNCYTELPTEDIVVTSYKGITIYEKEDRGKYHLVKTIPNERGKKVLALTDDRFAIADIDSITIFSSKDFSIVTKMLWAHFGDTNGLIQLKDGRLCSGGGCNDDDVISELVKFWNLDTYTCQNECSVFDIICYTENSLKELIWDNLQLKMV